MAFELKYLGHSGFEIKVHNQSILIDPLLSTNPHYDYLDENIVDIFITHGHSDHIGNSIDIAKNKRAMITAVFELANYLSEKGAKTNGINLGGWIDYNWGRAIFLPAFHSSSNMDGIYTGCPTGILFEIEGMKVFHAGDTCLNTEMKIIKELYKPDIAMLPIGGHYTMGIKEAAIATQWIGAKIVIPIHYNTFNAIQTDVNRFKMLVEPNAQCAIMQPNDVLSF